MPYVQMPSDNSYRSWIKLEEHANKVLAALEQHNQLLSICNINDVHANSVVVLDTSDYEIAEL